ncbi:MAG TPA: acyl-ACP thioesterase domain-containing protein [Desulfuromonadaceae bacterium]|jgi:acyl-ACP thioesterase
MTDSPVLEQEFPVRYHELDSHGNIRPVTLLNYLQDTAGLHAAQLGVAVADLRVHGLTWVLSRVHLIIERYPRAGEQVVVRTWPATREGLFTCREFELIDSGPVGRATTSWAVLNVATRRPVKLEGHLPIYPLLARRAIEDDFSPLPFFQEPAAAELAFRVLRGDLDINQHVNNAIYVGWALEAVPEEIALGCLTELEVSFRAEALYGETVLSRCNVVQSGTSTCCIHQIINQQDNRELARLRTRWSV